MTIKSKRILSKKRRKEELSWYKTKDARNVRNLIEMQKQQAERMKILAENPWVDTDPPPPAPLKEDYRPTVRHNKRDFIVIIDGEERWIPHYLSSQSDEELKIWILANLGEQHVETVLKAMNPFSS